MVLQFFMTFFPLLLFRLSFAISPTLSNFGLPEGTSLKNEYYEIQSVETSLENPGFLKFRVHSQHAVYEVVGVVQLIKLLREIEVIEKVRRNEKTSGFFDGAASSVEATKDGFVNLVGHPIASAKGVGKAAGKVGKKIGGIFSRKEKGGGTPLGEKLLGSSKRELAEEFGVDVYTTNPYLNEILNQMARARLGGKGAAAVFRFLIPVAGIASVTLTASGVNSAADQLVNDASVSDLFRLNEQALLSLGFDKKSAGCLLNSSVLTPREVTYFRHYLESLKNVQGYKVLLPAICKAQTSEAARKILYETQIAAEEAARNPQYENLEILSAGLALSDAGRLILITACDYLDWSGLGDQILLTAGRLAKEEQKNVIEIWNGGKATEEFFALASNQNIKVRSRLLF